MSDLTPEQRESAEKCDQITNAILEGCAGMPVGVAVGASLNVLQECCAYLNGEDRAKVTARMRALADEIDANPEQVH